MLECDPPASVRGAASGGTPAGLPAGRRDGSRSGGRSCSEFFSPPFCVLLRNYSSDFVCHHLKLFSRLLGICTYRPFWIYSFKINMTEREKRVGICSTCGRPAEHHVGPPGKKCNMDPLEDVLSQTSDHESDHSSHGGTKNALMELTSQLGKLTLSMKDIQDDLSAVKNEVRSGRAASDPRPSYTSHRMASDYLSAGGSAAPTTEAPVCLPSGAKVSSKIITMARSGEFINLADFAPCLEPSLVTETSIVDGSLVFKPKRNIKSIDSFLMWSMAWRTYEEVLVSHDPTLYPALVSYRIFIQTCDAKYVWPSVYSYDVRNRASKSMSLSLEFNCIDNDIYITTMDSSSARANIKQCSRCKSIWHSMLDCPFQDDIVMPTTTKPQKNQQQQQQPAKSPAFNANGTRQICFNWNAGRCSDIYCQRLHVCSGCGGHDPKPRCIHCNLVPNVVGTRGRDNFGTTGLVNTNIPPPGTNSAPAGRLG
jgi:hypothetical protein